MNLLLFSILLFFPLPGTEGRPKKGPKQPKPLDFSMDWCDSVDEPYNVDVLIAGVGFAGFGAMYEFELYNRYVNGYMDGHPELVLGDKTARYDLETICYKALEADKYLGGRALAAKYLSGGEGNSAFELTWDIFKNNDVIVSQQHWWDIYYHNLDLANGNELNTVLSEWENAYDCLQAYANPYPDYAITPSLDQSMRNVLDDPEEYCDPWNPDTPFKKMLEWYDVQYEHSLELDEIMAFANEPILTYFLLQDKDYFVSITKELKDAEHDDFPSNLAAVVQKAVEKYITVGGLFTDRVEKNMLIKKINWNTPGEVEIIFDDISDLSSPDESTINAKKALITFSIGVLKAAEGASMFVPPLNSATNPSGKIEMLEKWFYFDSDDKYKDTMGLYNVLYIQLSKELWDDADNKDYEIIFSIQDSIDRATACTVIHNLDRGPNEFYQGSRVFSCALMTDEVKWLDEDPDRITGLIDNLFEALGLDETYFGNDCEDIGQAESLDYYDPCDFLFNPPISSSDPNCNDAGSHRPCLYQYRSSQHTIQVGQDPEIDRQDVWKGSWASSIPYDGTGSPPSVTEFVTEMENVVRAPTRWTASNKTALHFAGEAYCDRWAGYTHGALDSGRLEARNIIYEMNGIEQGSPGATDWEAISDTYLVKPICDLPIDAADFGPPYKGSKTIPH